MAANIGDEDDGAIFCRICYLGYKEKALIKVCRCRGSLEFVHQDCIDEWVNKSKEQHCICGYEMRVEEKGLKFFKRFKFGLLYPFVYEKELVTWLCRLFVRLELLQILTYYSLIFYLLTFNYFKIITPKRLRKMRQKRYQFMVKAIDNRQTQ